MRIRLLGAIVLATAFLVPISSAHAAEPTIGGYFSSDTHGCGSMKVFVPNSNQFTAQETGFSKQSIPLRERALSKMQGRKIHWLTSMTCKPGRAHHTLTTTSHSSLSPAVDNAVNWTPNWSGYVDNVSGAIGVTQDWTQPILNDADNGAFVDSSIWPGIGGFNNNVLVQDGTDISGSCSGDGGCSYNEGSPYFWVEALPDNPTELIVTNLAVEIGDDVSALTDFNYSTHTAEFQLCNNVLLECVDGSHTMNNGANPGPTVEWIAERADFSGTLPELNDFGQLTIEIAEYGDANGQTRPVAGTAYTMETCDQSQELAIPGSIGSFTNGPYFNDQFENLGHSDRYPC